MYPSTLFRRFALLAISALSFVAHPAPLLRIDTLLHIPVEGGVGPIFNAPHQAMFHRIEMQVIHVPPEIAFVTDHMLPVPALPEGGFVSLPPAVVQPFWTQQYSAAPLGNETFDHHLPFGDIGIPVRQGPDTMQMVRQKHPASNGERVKSSHFVYGFAQRGTDNLIAQESLPSIGNHREEIGASRCLRSPVG